VNGGTLSINPWSTSDYAVNRWLVPNAYQGTAISLGGFTMNQLYPQSVPYNSIASGGPLQTPTNFAMVTDGTSSTLLVGEKAMDIADYNAGGWWWNEPVFASGGAGGCGRDKAGIFPDHLSPSTQWFADYWGSAHPGAPTLCLRTVRSTP